MNECLECACFEKCLINGTQKSCECCDDDFNEDDFNEEDFEQGK